MDPNVAQAATDFCMHHGLELYLQDASQLYAAALQPAAVGSSVGSQGLDPCSFMARYLTSVVCSRHVIWRNYAYVAGTSHNRKCFLNCSRRVLLQASTRERLSFGDIHSLLQLLCPDFPASVLNHAWSPAVNMQKWLDDTRQDNQQCHSQPAHQLESDIQLVQLPVLWQCLEVTFFYEHCLLLIRKSAFNSDKRCISLQQLDASMQQAATTLGKHGWPVPPARCWRAAVNQASRAATHPDFPFSDLVRALCCSQDVVKAVRGQLQEAAAAAALSSEALAAASASRGSSSTDNGQESPQ